MKILLVLCVVLFGYKSMAGVNQYFRFVGNDKKVHVGLKKDADIFDQGVCEGIDCFLEAIKNGKVGTKIKSQNFIKTTKFAPPVPNPKQILAAAMNFGKHQEETNIKELILFPKIADITSWNTPVPHYGTSKDYLDYEVEIGYLLNRDITKEDVEGGLDLTSAIAGVFLTLDMTSRELQVRHGSMFNSEKGFSISKSLSGYAPSGQYFISYQDFKNGKDQFQMSLSVNKEVKQNSGLKDMLFWPEDLIKFSFMPKFFKRKFDAKDDKSVKIHSGQLFKGDVVISGTPAGMIFIAPTFKTKMIGFLRGLKSGNPVKYAQDYILKNQPLHLMPGDKIEAEAVNLGKIMVDVIRP